MIDNFLFRCAVSEALGRPPRDHNSARDEASHNSAGKMLGQKMPERTAEQIRKF